MNNDYKKGNRNFAVSVLYFFMLLALVCPAVTGFYAMCVSCISSSVHRTSVFKISSGHTDIKYKTFLKIFSTFLEVIQHIS
jgi:hypothetical protein